MKPVTQVHDALWHCLCPSFSNRAFRAFAAVPWPTRLSQQPRQRSATHKTRQYSSQQHSSTAGYGKRLRISIHARPPQPQNQLLRQNLDAATNADLHEELDRRATDGDIEWVRYLVQSLVYERSEKPDQRHYLALILANTNVDYGSAGEVKRYLDEMSSAGLSIDSAICHAVLKVLAVHPDYVLRAVILEEMKRRWHSLTTSGWHYLIAGLLRDRQIELALEKFNEMQTNFVPLDPWLLQLLVYTLVSVSAFPEAHAFLDLRFSTSSTNYPVPSALWSHVLTASASSLYHPLVSFVWSHAVRMHYLNPPTGTCTSVLESCARQGDYRLATEVFHILGKRSSPIAMHHYESLLETYLASSLLPEALQVLTIMQQSSPHTPTDATARPLYLFLRSHVAKPHQALSILTKRAKPDTPPPIPALNAIIEAHVFHKDLPAALSAYKTIHTLNPSGPTTYTFNALFRGCAHDARKDTAMFLASEMRALSVPPDALTYDRLMLTCLNGSTEEDLRDAWRYMDEMRGRGWWPRRGTVLVLARKSCEFGDERVWEMLAGCEERGMDMVATRRWVEGSWNQRLGWEERLRAEDGAGRTVGQDTRVQMAS